MNEGEGTEYTHTVSHEGPYYKVICSNTLTKTHTHTQTQSHTHTSACIRNIANQTERVYLLVKEREEKTLDIFYILSAVLIQSICYEKELFAARVRFVWMYAGDVSIHRCIYVRIYIRIHPCWQRNLLVLLHNSNGRCVFVVSLSLYISI